MGKASVVLAMYNGQKYIKEQLDSIRNQLYEPYEVLIIDDCSADDSVNIVFNYIEEWNLKNWHLICNETNLGWKKNFIQGFNKTKGDYIFCCDQDDIWLPDKLLLMCDAMDDNPKINYIACNMIGLYDESKKEKVSNKSLKKYGHDRICSVYFDKHWETPLRPGCTIGFRSSQLKMINKTWFDDCPHDLLLWSLGVVSESFYILNEQLVIHRRHDNTNTPSNKKTKDTRLYNVKIQIDLSESILHNYDLYSSNKFILDEITRYLDVLRERYKLILSGNVFSFSLMLGKYIRYYSVKTMVGDLISSFR